MDTPLSIPDPVEAVARANRPETAPPESGAETAPQIVATLTVGETARRFAVAENTIARWCDSGYLKATRTAGGHRRIDAAHANRVLVERWAQEITPTVTPGTEGAE
ncbi:MAG: helix-turn-helix domain-containing protein [Sporichthyaceae bacterium]